ncbi:hypothetical protein [Polyangium aurulentum]|uniref:hypothetical protein n=1 Tax=Polyangium aurulentum TaxID=2567896 RepID=UPI0010AEDB26|nr:hypothetical protein [Polyangium aurulentum]UQA63376.1 hypothetical protein E8A73_024070 [Polyangium aurulentum]
MKRRVLVGWIGVLLGTSCGLLGGEGSLAIPADGVGAFGEATPLEVCLGTARIVAPAAATGAEALCVPEARAARACGADAACEGIERCVCGRCVVRACQGAGACEGNEVCRGRRCTRACAADSDCDAAERCVSGGCARRCGGDGDCHSGERCDALDDVCATSLCGSGGTCGAGSRCEDVARVAELHEPAFLGDAPVAFVELRKGGGAAVHRALVEAPGRWRVDPEEPVVAMAGESLGAPSAIRRGDRIELYVAAENPPRIVRAVSADGGASFAVDMDPVLVAAEAWEGGWVGSPAVVDFEGAPHLYYEGGPRAGIGLVRLGEGEGERVEKNPVLAPEDVEDGLFWRGLTEVGAPHALVVDGAVRLFFTGRGAEGTNAASAEGALPAERNDSIGLATTRDLGAYSLFPAGPVFARIVNLRAYLGEREATIRVSPEGAEIVFVSTNASGESVSGLFRAGGR